MGIEISPYDLQQLLTKDHQINLIDVREAWERDAASIGGKHIPMNKISEISTLFNNTDHLVLYCHHGVRSFMAVRFLIEQGFTNSQSLRGAIDLWSKKIDHNVPTY